MANTKYAHDRTGESMLHSFPPLKGKEPKELEQKEVSHDELFQVLISIAKSKGSLNSTEENILRELANHPIDVVSRQTLLNNCWPDRVVSNGSLTVAIKKIRDIFRQCGLDGIIITMPKRGYMLNISSLSTSNLNIALGNTNATNEPNIILNKMSNSITDTHFFHIFSKERKIVKSLSIILGYSIASILLLNYLLYW
ncbi:winged helix-turn-helix domain-containing protein [Vibrio nomapromontoriensis]|uniref:winged helix-turn-helix domain-containing protein n=1 Tax=Vibrio nomapromontoriensis TaxID=2910246 RepID=UPI003D141113